MVAEAKKKMAKGDKKGKYPNLHVHGMSSLSMEDGSRVLDDCSDAFLFLFLLLLLQVLYLR